MTLNLSLGEGEFYVINYTAGRYYKIFAVPLYENSACMVYAEADRLGNPLRGITEAAAREIGDEYAENIEPRITGAFGEIYHITPGGKVTLLLVDIRDGYDPLSSASYVAGYFSPTDMDGGPYSNRRDILYIDTYPGLSYKDSLYATAAHELQHLVNFSNTCRKNGGREMDLWINEGLSTAAEYIYSGTDPSRRVSMYNYDDGETIKQGNNFFVWYGYWELSHEFKDFLADYATAYLFFQWLRIHADNGAEIYKNIMNYGENGTTDYRAVIGAAKERIPGLGLNGSDEENWEKLLRTWMAANWRQSSSGLYGYKGQISAISGGASSLTTHVLSGRPSLTLYPGEGVFSLIGASPYTPSGPGGVHIRYAGIGDSDGPDIETPYEGTALLTFNANANKAENKPAQGGETGYLAGIQSIMPQSGAVRGPPRSRSASPAGLSGPYPIDGAVLLKKLEWEKNGER